jgi:hypothetical protein
VGISQAEENVLSKVGRTTGKAFYFLCARLLIDDQGLEVFRLSLMAFLIESFKALTPDAINSTVSLLTQRL